MVFDIKLDFTVKARMASGGHATDPPTVNTHASVVSSDSMRICLMLVALNDYEVICADVNGAYLNAPTGKKVYTVAGKEFGEFEGRLVVIVHAVYGLKSSGAAWRSHLAQSLRDIGFTSSLCDPDVWMCKATQSDGLQY